MRRSSDSAFVLRVYVSGQCPMTERVKEVTAAVERHLPRVRVEIVNVDTTREPVPAVVFSVPTYTFNERVVALGNPGATFVDDLRELMESS